MALTPTDIMQSLSLNSTWTLNSGYSVPVMGYGTYLIPPNQTAEAVGHAFDQGYRLIDCATYYGNEAEVAEAMRLSGIPRDELFFTSKSPPPNGYNNTINAVERSLEVTGLDYIDLYLIHTAAGNAEDRLGSWRALVEAVEQGKVRSIGVSNFEVSHLQELEAWIFETEQQEGVGKGGVLSVLQVELHPWVNQTDVADWAFQRGVQMQGWSPLVRAERFNESILHQVGAKHSRTPAQVLLRWSLQHGFTPLPKAAQLGHMKENVQVFDFELDKDDLMTLTTGIDDPYTEG